MASADVPWTQRPRGVIAGSRRSSAATVDGKNLAPFEGKMVDEASHAVWPLWTPKVILRAPRAMAGRDARMEIILHRLTSPGPVAANIAAGVRKGWPVSPPVGETALHFPAFACGGARLFPSTVCQYDAEPTQDWYQQVLPCRRRANAGKQWGGG